MKTIICLALLKIATAQMMPYSISGTNGINSPGSALPTFVTSQGSITGPASFPVASGYSQMSNNMAPGYMSNPNLANAMTTANVANSRLANTNFEYASANNLDYANVANANPIATTANINAVKTANAILSAENAASNLVNGNNLFESILESAEDLRQTYIPPVLNGNMATFYLGNNGNTFTVTSGSPGTQGIGVQVMADALEVGGTVAVNGKIPIYGMVGINGNIPTDGMASVSYSCANPSTLL